MSDYSVVTSNVPGFDKDRTAFAGERKMLAVGRVTQPGSLRIDTLFILKHATQDEYLFSARMRVRFETGIRSPAH